MNLMVKEVFYKVREELVSLLYPKSCFYCQRPLAPQADLYLCDLCQSKLQLNLPPFCSYCGIHIDIPGEDQCPYCLRQNFHFQKGYTVFLYQGLLKEGLHRFKYEAGTYLGYTLARYMINFAAKYIDRQGIDLLVPVPLHWKRLRDRGFNQSFIFVKNLSRHLAIPCATPVKKVKQIIPQVELTRRERLVNVVNSFKVTRPNLVNKKKVLLVDDVFTTGATLNECSREILKAGAQQVQVFTLARGVVLGF